MGAVVFGYEVPDELEVKSPETAQVANISRNLSHVVGLIERFLKEHPHGRCGCVFCETRPHAREFLSLIAVTADMQVEYLDRCRAPVEQEVLDAGQ